MSRFPFVQFVLAGELGVSNGRYPARPPGSDGEGGTHSVLVTRTFGAAAPRRGRRKQKPRAADPQAELALPVTELTVIDADPLEGDPGPWLKRIGRDDELRDEVVSRALATARRAVAARRVAAADPDVSDPSVEAALATRVGYGQADDLVDGRYEEAIELPRETRRSGRIAALRPQERMAAILGGRERPLACEELILRARADLDGARGREAALQLRVGLEALLADRDRFGQQGQDDDLAALEARRGPTGAAANEALAGDLTPDRAAEVAATVELCERVLRRKALRG